MLAAGEGLGRDRKGGVREDELLKLEESHSSLVGLRPVTLGLLAVTLRLLSDSNF